MKLTILLVPILILFLIPALVVKVKSKVEVSTQKLGLSDLDKRKIILSILGRTTFGEPNLKVSEQSNAV
ncbi:MAG: hypothetical protein ABI686_13700, partial [Acidobacteriota bacterium]